MNWKESRSTCNCPKTKTRPSPWTSPSSKSSLWTRTAMSKSHHPSSHFFWLHQVSVPVIWDTQLLWKGVLHPVSVNFPGVYHLNPTQSWNPSESLQGEPDTALSSMTPRLILPPAPHFLPAPDFAGQSECFKGPRPRAGFWQLNERRESFSRAGGRLHFGHPAKAEGRQEQRESVTGSNASSGDLNLNQTPCSAFCCYCLRDTLPGNID